jgi:hypothetical protein
MFTTTITASFLAVLSALTTLVEVIVYNFVVLSY